MGPDAHARIHRALQVSLVPSDERSIQSLYVDSLQWLVMHVDVSVPVDVHVHVVVDLAVDVVVVVGAISVLTKEDVMAGTP